MELNPYAKYLDGRDPIPVLTSTSERIHALTGRLSTSEANTLPAPGKWSISNIVAHLADTEMVFAFRLRQTLAEDNHVIQPFDQEKWAAAYTAVTAQQALAAFTAQECLNFFAAAGYDRV